jgi:hypothetical protein
VTGELTIRWTPLRWHAEQARLWASPARFKIVAAGRRSGKTELCKREGVALALSETELPSYRAVFAAPTHDQAKSLFWEDVKKLVPRWALARAPIESRRRIWLRNGARIDVVGLDKPERIEGEVLDWIGVDEFANCKADVWDAHLRPALFTEGRRPGRAWIFGVPEGRNHYQALYQSALRHKAEEGEKSEWDVFTWPSSDILPQEEIEKARRELDELTFAQEYEASFVNFAGRAYYPFTRERHAFARLPYDPKAPLLFCFDFNVKPGVCAVGQEWTWQVAPAPWVAIDTTNWIGEVWIPDSSNTPAVCRKLIADWGPGGRRAGAAGHEGRIYLHGDFTGGGRSTVAPGNNWQVIELEMRRIFGGRVSNRVVKNPPERSRVNAVNSRLESVGDRMVHMLFDPAEASHGVDDFEGTVLLKGGSGEIDKDKYPERTHWSDAAGYYVADRHPIRKGGFAQADL